MQLATEVRHQQALTHTLRSDIEEAIKLASAHYSTLAARRSMYQSKADTMRSQIEEANKTRDVALESKASAESSRVSSSLCENT